jgi:excisionase family DNA binding protein
MPTPTPLPSANLTASAPPSAPVSTPLAVAPLEAARLLSLGVTKIYWMMRDGELDNFYCGRARRIPIAAIQNYVAKQLAAGTRRQGTQPRRRGQKSKERG